MDIVLQRVRVYSIRGKASALANSGISDQMLSIAAKGPRKEYEVDPSALVHPDGSFEFRGIQPGTYVISGGQAWANAGATPPLFTPQEVTVTAADVEGVFLTMIPEIDLAGTFTLEGGKPEGWPEVMLQESDGPLTAGNVSVDPKGAFRFPRKVAPSRYRVELYSLPPGTYVKSIRYGSQDLIHAPLDLTGGAGGSVDVVLSANVATLDGTVKGADDAPAKGVLVSLWPRMPVVGGGIKTVSTDQRGHFEVIDLGPGDYFAAAWEEIDPGLIGSPEFMDRFTKEITAVRVGEGGQVNVKLIPLARVAAEAAKLQ
jgi:hypothetical protein